MTAPNALVAAEVVRMQAEINDLRALVATCVCPSWPPEGPSEDCPVHGAVRAFNAATAALVEMTADRDAMIPIVTAAQKLVLGWRVSGTSGLPWTPRALLDAVNAYQAGVIPVAVDRGAPTTPTAGEETPSPLPTAELSAEDLDDAAALMVELPILEDPFVAVTRSEYASLRSGAGALVAELLDVSANLEEHIQTRADEIAAPRVAQAESVAVGKIAEVIAQAEHDKQRSDDLLAELRRVLAAQCKNVDLYFPQVQRVKALADAWRKAGMDGEAQDIYGALNPKEAEVTT